MGKLVYTEQRIQVVARMTEASTTGVVVAVYFIVKIVEYSTQTRLFELSVDVHRR